MNKETQMKINYGQKVKLTIKRDVIGDDGNPIFGKIDIEEIEGTVSGVFQEDWLSVYAGNKHFIIDLRND